MIATKTDIAKLLQRIEKLEDFNTSFPYIEPSTIIEGLHQEFDNKQLILEILDMLSEYANDGDAGPLQPILPRRDLQMRDKCSKLQRKLTGTVK